MDSLDDGSTVIVSGNKVMYMSESPDTPLPSDADQHRFPSSEHLVSPLDRSAACEASVRLPAAGHHCARGGTGTNQVKRQLQVPPTQQPLVPHRLGRTRFGSRARSAFPLSRNPMKILTLLRRHAEKTSSEKGYRMTMFVRPQDPYDESWNGPRSGPEGACEVFGADDVRPSFLLSKSVLTRSDRTSMQACDVAHFSRRLEDALSSSRGPVYIEHPDISASSFSRSRPTSTSNRTSFFDYLSSAGSKRTPVDEVDRVLGALGKRDVRSAAREIEKLRVVKSEAEVRVMRKAADISADAHSKVAISSSLIILRLLLTGARFPSGHALLRSTLRPRPYRAFPRLSLRVQHLPRGVPATRLRPRLRIRQPRAHDPLHREQSTTEGGGSGAD